MRIFYFLVLAVSVAFHILYKGDISFVLLMFMIILPFVMLAMLITAVLMTDISVHTEQPSAPRGKAAVLKITVRNRSVFPVCCCVAKIQYKSRIPFDPTSKKRYRLTAAIGARSSETFIFNISASHCGAADIFVKKILMRDYLQIFSIPVKASAAEKIISLPVIYPVKATVEGRAVSTDESTAFSPYKQGDDPSEIFALREYREGDSNNRIHWKLSSRSENFIVKELSLPVGCKLLVIADFFGCGNASETDRVLDAAFSVSDFLAEHGTEHTFAYARSDYSVRHIEINNPDKRLFAAAETCSELEKASTAFSFVQAAATDDFFASQKLFSRVITVTDSIDFSRTDELETLFGEAYITVICTGVPDKSRKDNDENYRMEIIYADAEKLGDYELLII